VKNNLPINDVVLEYLQLKPAGSYLKGSCPFHSETDASFTVSPDKQIFYCFGCHASGDVIGFIAKIENLTQREAAQHVIERYGIEIPEHILKSKSFEFLSNKDEKRTHYKVCQAVAEWAHKKLLDNSTAKGYLEKRGITEKI